MSRGRARWSFLLRCTIGVLLLYWLFHSIGVEAFHRALAALLHDPLPLLAAIVLTLLALLAGAWRWHLLLRTLDLPAPFRHTLRAFFIGQFFNAFLFGACGGDLTRALLAAQRHPQRRTEAATSVLIDRGLGILLTLLFGLLMLLPHLPDLLHGHAPADPLTSTADTFYLLFFLLSVGALLFLLLRFLLRNNHRLAAFLQRLPLLRRPFIRDILSRILAALRTCCHTPSALFWPFFLSLANLLLLTAATGAIAIALDLHIPPIGLLTIFPVITLLAAIPVTPGGLGIRETLYIGLLAPMGIPPASAFLLSMLTYLTGTFWSLPGAIFLLFPAPDAIMKSHEPAPPPGT